MRTLVLGGDGFCGWPTCLHLSACGHEIAIVDNLARRSADLELEAESLTPIRPLGSSVGRLAGAHRPLDLLSSSERRGGLPGATGAPAESGSPTPSCISPSSGRLRIR